MAVSNDSAPSSVQVGSLRVAEHTDFGMFTFLLLGDGARGLQVRKVDGKCVFSGRVVPHVSSATSGRALGATVVHIFRDISDQKTANRRKQLGPHLAVFCSE
jgi:isopenicillin N synthase-like dioxygenase